MTSAAMLHKIAKMREAAPSELLKARLCAHVVLTTVDPGAGNEAADAVRSLKKELGSNWSTTTAFQFMSGRQAEFASECGSREEQPVLYLAHLIAKDVSHRGGISGGAPADSIEIAKFKALVLKRMSASS